MVCKICCILKAHKLEATLNQTDLYKDTYCIAPLGCDHSVSQILYALIMSLSVCAGACFPGRVQRQTQQHPQEHLFHLPLQQLDGCNGIDGVVLREIPEGAGFSAITEQGRMKVPFNFMFSESPDWQKVDKAATSVLPVQKHLKLAKHCDYLLNYLVIEETIKLTNTLSSLVLSEHRRQINTFRV